MWGSEIDTPRRPDECSLSPPTKLKDVLSTPPYVTSSLFLFSFSLPYLFVNLYCRTHNTSVFMREIGNGDIPVTLVVLNWRRTHNFPFIFDLIGKYPFVTEYIVSKNNTFYPNTFYCYRYGITTKRKYSI